MLETLLIVMVVGFILLALIVILTSTGPRESYVIYQDNAGPMTLALYDLDGEQVGSTKVVASFRWADDYTLEWEPPEPLLIRVPPGVTVAELGCMSRRAPIAPPVRCVGGEYLLTHIRINFRTDK